MSASKSPPRGGARIETAYEMRAGARLRDRPLAGGRGLKLWKVTRADAGGYHPLAGGRGLKPYCAAYVRMVAKSPPRGGGARIETPAGGHRPARYVSPPRGGARIETLSRGGQRRPQIAPSRGGRIETPEAPTVLSGLHRPLAGGRGLKPVRIRSGDWLAVIAPSRGGAD